MSRYLESLLTTLREYRIAIGLLLCAAFVLSGYVAFGPKPWVSGVAPHEAAGEKLRPEHYVVSAMWWAVLANLAIIIGVLVASPFLLRRLPAGMPDVPSTGVTGKPRSILIGGLLLAALVSGILQAPRLSLSLWGDEEYTAKRFVAGYYRRDGDGAMEHKMPEWVNTIWDFRSGANNHQLFSVLSRMSHSTLHAESDDPGEEYFSEGLIRLPSFLASLGTVFAVGWLVALLGAPRGAVVAAFFLALHPWFLRYGPEARGYPLMMLLLVLSLIFLFKATTAGRWRDWLAFGLAEFLCFVSYMGSLYFILMLNLAGLLLVCFAQREKSARLPQFGRFAVSNALAAGLVIAVVSPAIAPLKAWYEKKVKQGVWGEPPDADWIADALCYLGTGLPWNPWDALNPLSLHLSAMPRVLVGALLIVTAALVGAGILRLLITGKTYQRILLIALLLPGPLMVAEAVVMKNFLFSWYLLISLPMVVVFLGLGVDWLVSGAKSAKLRTGGAALIAVALFTMLLIVTSERIQLLRSRSVEPLHESVALTRTVHNPKHPDIDAGVITVGFVMWTEAYDPAAKFIRTAEELQAALDEARSEGKDLYVNFGQFLLARESTPEIMAMIEDDALFEEVAVLHGLWQPCTRWVYRAKL